MKKIAATFVAMLSVFFIFSCNDKKQAESQKPETSTITESFSKEEQQKEPQKSYQTSMMISDGWTLCVQNADGTMKSAKQTDIGELVEIVLLDGAKIEKTADWKFANGTSTKDILWILVKYEYEEYWTRDLFVVDSKNAPTLAVLQSDSHIYTTSDDMSMTKDVLKAGSKVVLSGKSANNFSEICVYNGKPYGKKVFIESNKISTSEGDIEYFNCLKKYEAQKNDLKPQVKAEIEELLEELKK